MKTFNIMNTFTTTHLFSTQSFNELRDKNHVYLFDS